MTVRQYNINLVLSLIIQADLAQVLPQHWFLRVFIVEAGRPFTVWPMRVAVVAVSVKNTGSNGARYVTAVPETDGVSKQRTRSSMSRLFREREKKADYVETLTMDWMSWTQFKPRQIINDSVKDLTHPCFIVLWETIYLVTQ